MNRCVVRPALLAVALAAGLPAGCHKAPPPQEEPLLQVNWSFPVERVVTDHVDFTGRLDSINAVDIKPRITGYIVRTPFKEGSEVKQDDLLFEIDRRTYKATLDQNKADVQLTDAKWVLAKANNVRAKQVKEKNPAAISQQELEQYDAVEKESLATLLAARAKVEMAQIYYDWCKVQSPIDGLISRYYFTTGNLVNQDTTLLTTIVSLNPIYAYFDMDERTLLTVRNAIMSGRLKYKRPPDEMAGLFVSSLGRLALAPNPWEIGRTADTVLKAQEIAVSMRLTTETGFPHQGTINFINNKVDPLTGTITVRGVFANPKGAQGVRLMSPGMFTRIRLPISEPYPALLVAQKVVLTDQGLKNVYVLDKDDKIQYRRVTLGAVQPDGLQVILSGIQPTDRIALSNLQFVRPEMQVEPTRKPMPTENGQGRQVLKK